MFVSQKIIIINREGRILALRRSDTDPSRPLTWDLPGGQLEEGEDVKESIKRETKEEAGIEVEDCTVFNAVAGTNKNGEYWVQIGYIAKVDMPTITLSYEHDQYQWLTKEVFIELESSEKIKRLLVDLSL